MKRWYLVGIGLIILYLVLAFATTQVLHFSRALDEGYHLDFITFIKNNGRLPVNYEERAEIARADLPPLYHMLVNWLTFGVDATSAGQPVIKLYKDSTLYQAIDFGRENPWTIDTEDLTWPYYGQFLVWQVGRWLSVLLSLATLIVVFLVLQEIPLGQHPLTSLFGAAFLAFIPRYLIVSSALNDDSLLGLVSAVYFWMLVKVVKSPERWWPFIVMGGVLGVSLTVKYSLILIPIEIAVVFVAVAYRQGLGWGWFVKRLVTVGFLMLLFSSWWFGWNLWHFNTIAKDGVVAGVVRAMLAGGYNATLNQISGMLVGGEVSAPNLPVDTQVGTGTPLQWISLTFYSFWGFAVGNKIPLSPYVFVAVGMLLVAALIGLVRMWQSNLSSRRWILLAGFHTILLFVIPIIRFVTSGRLGQTAQGRHILIPAAAAIVALIVWGLAAIIPRKRQPAVFGLIVAALITWTGIHIYQLYLPNDVPLLPMRTLTQAAEWLPEPANAHFGDGVELVSYELDPHPEQGLLKLNLAWRSLDVVKESYLLKVTILNAAGEAVSQWVGYNGNSRLPTIAWDPGDSVFDRLNLPLPNLPAGTYSVQLQLLSQNGRAVPVHTGDTQQPALDLAEVTLAASTFKLPETQTWVAWNASGPVASDSLQFRYPGSISVILDSPGAVELVTADGSKFQPKAVANNVSTFVIGPRWPGGSYSVEINGQAVDPILSVENWWPRRFEAPNIETPTQANFADQVQLLGYNLSQNRVRAGDSFPLTLYWQAPIDKSPQANFIQFNNLLDSGGTLHGGYDRLPLENYSTLLWAPGEVVVDGYAVPVNPDAPPGQYYLDVGLYLTVGESAVNLPLVVDGKMTDVTSVTIGPIEVVK